MGQKRRFVFLEVIMYIASFKEFIASNNCDADYFQPKHTTNTKAIKTYPGGFATLGSLVDMKKGIEVGRKAYRNNGVPFTRVSDVRPTWVLQEKYISEGLYNSLKNDYQPGENEILLTKDATPGIAHFLGSDPPKMIPSGGVLRLKRKSAKVCDEYLTLVLNSGLVQKQIDRDATGSVLTHWRPERISQTLIPILPKKEQLEIRTQVLASFRLLAQSEALLEECHEIVLKELGVSFKDPKTCVPSIVMFSDFQEAGLMDADYFQAKCKKVVQAIKDYGCATLGSLVEMRKGVEVGKKYSKTGVPFIRVSNITQYGLSKEKHIPENLYQTLKSFQPEKGEILLTKDATPGVAYYLSVEPNKMVMSGGVLRLRKKSEKVNSEYLTLVLNSTLVREQVKRAATGSVIVHWRPERVAQTLIPILPKNMQTLIQQKVRKSFLLRRKSKFLLICVKQAVETAVKSGKPVAFNETFDKMREQLHKKGV